MSSGKKTEVGYWIKTTRVTKSKDTMKVLKGKLTVSQLSKMRGA